MRSRLGHVAAPAVLLALALAGCGGGGEEKPEDAEASPSAIAADLSEQCELLGGKELAELAGTALEHPEPSFFGDLPTGACTWRDSELTDYTVEVRMSGAAAGVWSSELDSTLNGSLDSDDLQELIDTEELRADLSDEQACGLWAEVTDVYFVTPKDDVAADTFRNDYDDDDRYVSRAEICRDGVYAELFLTSDEEISKDRAALVKAQVETVWERARETL